MTSDAKPIRVYKASAGSGKTFTLAAEFIANLLNDFNPVDNAHRHQLAITFTKKATNEMKERILQYLFELAYVDDLTKVGILYAVRDRLTQPLGDQQIRARARQTLHQILHGYDHFRVMTIDSFFQSMLTSLAHDLGLSAGFRVELNDKNTTSRAVEKMLRELRPGSLELEWVTRFVEQRLEESKSWNVSYPLNALAEELTKEAYMTNADRLRALPLSSAVVNGYRNHINQHKEQAQQLIRREAEVLDARISADKDGYGVLKYGKKSFQDFLKKYIDWDFGKNKSVGDVETKTIDAFIANPTDKITKKFLGARNEWVESIAADFAAFRQKTEEGLICINSCELSTKNLNPLRLLDTIDKEVRAINRESNAFMLAYTPLLFHKLVGTDEVSFVFERAGTNFRHIMIDEFQDTSRLQWANLRHLFCETASTDNSSMIVGDVKQGIYRWRGGDWNALARFTDDEYTEIKHLERNYRSGERIVRFNNALFVRAAQVLDRDGLDETQLLTKLYDEREVAQQQHNAGGFVRIHVLPKPAAQSETESEEELATVEEQKVEHELAEQIVRMRQAGVPYDKMAILVRVKAEAQQVLSFFESLSDHEYFRSDPIQLMSDEAFLLEASPAVQTIVHTLRLILHADDGVARAYVEAHCSPEQHAKVFEKIHQWQGEFYRNVPFYELVEQIVELFALNAQKGQAPYLYAFLDAVITFLEENIPDIATFLKYWDEKLHEQSIPSAAAKGVRILTIHKSKGLDFHTVFIPYCNWKIEEDRGSDILWVEPNEAPYNEIPLLPIPLGKQTAKSIYASHYVGEHISRRIESLNIGYVAFTRPRQNIVVIAPYKDSNTFREVLAGALWRAVVDEPEWSPYLLKAERGKMPEGDEANDGKADTAPAFAADGELLFEWGEPSHLECETGGKKKERTNPLLFDPEAESVHYTLNARKVQVVQSNSAHLFNARLLEDADTSGEIEQLEARRRGEMLHAILENVESADQVVDAVERFAAEGRLVDNAKPETIVQQLTEALSHPVAREWFDGSWTLHREQNILRKGNTPQRPDRVMERNGETVVIDYKFGVPHRRHHEQVQHYCHLLSRMGRSNVRGYVWYVYAGRVEPVDLTM